MLNKRFEMKLDDERIKYLKEIRKKYEKAMSRKVSIAEVIRTAIDSYLPKF